MLSILHRASRPLLRTRAASAVTTRLSSSAAPSKPVAETDKLRSNLPPPIAAALAKYSTEGPTPDPGKDAEYRTQARPVYSLPFYGAPEAEILQLDADRARRALKAYGGLVRLRRERHDRKDALRKERAAAANVEAKQGDEIDDSKAGGEGEGESESESESKSAGDGNVEGEGDGNGGSKYIDTPDDWRARLLRLTRAAYRPKLLTISGVVVSDRMNKSVVIAARRPGFLKKYEYRYFKTRRFMAHDEFNLCREGDMVVIRSCRPLSNRKSHVVVQNFGDSRRVGNDDRSVPWDVEDDETADQSEQQPTSAMPKNDPAA